MDSGLPGEDIIEKGVADLERGVETVEALLVSIGSPRLSRIGIPIPRTITAPERRLYDLLARESPNAAHSRYNAWVRRLVSFEHAAECVSR